MGSHTHAGDIVFGRYTVDSLIAEGGQGYVWRGRDAVSGAPVAIKELSTGSLELRRRFENEAQVKLPCAQIVQPLQFGAEKETYFLVMEFVSGENLKEILERRGRLPEVEATRIVRQVAQGLAVAHSSNIIHRDIKPENILVTSDGAVKVTDFGIACFYTKERMTQVGATLGTAHYMSPEQVEDATKVDRSSDLFSLGIVYYESLTGAKPFDAELLGELFIAIISKEPVPPSQLVPGLSATAERMVMRMLAKRPADRYASMEDLLAAFDAHGIAPALSRPKERTGVPCPRCRTINAVGSSFCRSCGHDMRRPCAQCQSPIVPGASFCPSCGTPVVERAAAAYLVGIKGGRAGERLRLDTDFFTIGRHAANDISFDGGKDDFVSRFQARLFREKGCFWLEGWDWVKNCPTTNGTLVNGQNIDGKGKVPLRDGDRIRLGDSFFRFEAGAPGASSAGEGAGT